MSDLQEWMANNAETDGTLSLKVGVSRVQVRRIRLGDNKPSPKTALKIQEITGIPATVLLYGAEQGQAA